ncbi:hypothetical protein F0562_007170 [Nyssa sinensis]|uniref:Transcription repressor n=1 Tax=Nyssa sinensis TaxID=561372 RepID=A0A5J5A2M0_9ASTE|nr:hypothetical protein F0562_007170 [Nyssa sinensis]
MESPRGFLFDSPRLMLMMDPPPDLRGSQRFFVTTGPSSSLAEEARLSVSASTAHDGIAVPVYSSKPYDEFHGSMVEMVSSRIERDLTVDWDYMEELLLCYFDLNEKRFREHIMRAFVDVTMGLRQISGEKPATSFNIHGPPRSEEEETR